MQPWEYLSTLIEYIERDEVDESGEAPVRGWGDDETGPMESVGEVLGYYGAQGWELVTLAAHQWDNFRANAYSSPFDNSRVMAYFAAFKRPKP